MSATGYTDPRIPRGDPGDRQANGLRDGLQCSRPLIGASLLCSSGSGGIAIAARRPRRSKGTVSIIDFSLYDASTTVGETTTYLLGVRNGSITTAGVLTNGSGSALPTGMTAGGDPAYTQEIASETVAWVELTIDDGGTAPEISDIFIDVGTSVPSNSSTRFCITLGDFFKDIDKKAVVIGSGKTGIGSQIVEGWRNWFSNPVTFAYTAYET